MNSELDTTIRVKKDVKRQLARLDFVLKDHSYNDIVAELIKMHTNQKEKSKEDSK